MASYVLMYGLGGYVWSGAGNSGDFELCDASGAERYTSIRMSCTDMQCDMGEVVRCAAMRLHRRGEVCGEGDEVFSYAGRGQVLKCASAQEAIAMLSCSMRGSM